jgi:hypothetical protein
MNDPCLERKILDCIVGRTAAFPRRPPKLGDLACPLPQWRILLSVLLFILFLNKNEAPVRKLTIGNKIALKRCKIPPQI